MKAVLLVAISILVVVAVWLTLSPCPERGPEDVVRKVATPKDEGGPTRAPGEGDARLASIEKGLEWLMKQQKEDGHFGADEGPVVAITALSVTAIGRSPEAYRQKYTGQVEKAIGYILKAQQSDGSVCDAGLGLATYTTAISIMALASWDFEKHRGVILRARRYLEETQFSEGFQGIERSQAPYGGWGYDKQMKPSGDMSNTAEAAEALRIAGLPDDSMVWKRVVTFLGRSQNRGETNDFAVVTTNDEGFVYGPDQTRGLEETLPNGKKAFKSYGSMTVQGLKSMIYAGLAKDDPRVKGAFNWICRNYTLDENPGLSEAYGDDLGQRGLYYYYVAFAKALHAYGERYIETPDGKKHDWRNELTDRLISLQKPEGYWVNERNDKWMENDPVLVTAYSLIALSVCREEK